jgi:hypothetical protein
MASKKKFLTDPEIQELASLSSEQIEERLSSMDPRAARALIKNLISSYRLAARVANTAWKFWDVWQGKGSDLATAELELQQALHGYAPNIIPQRAGELESLVDELTFLLEQGSDDLMELIEMRRDDYVRALKKSEELPPRTPA